MLICSLDVIKMLMSCNEQKYPDTVVAAVMAVNRKDDSSQVEYSVKLHDVVLFIYFTRLFPT